MVKLSCPETINHPPERSCTCMIPYKQLSLADIFQDYQNKFDNNKYEFLELLENTINLRNYLVSLYHAMDTKFTVRLRLHFIKCPGIYSH